MSGSFTQAMTGGGGGMMGQNLGQQVQQVHRLIVALVQELQRQPGVNQQLFQQGVQQLQSGVQLIAQAMPQGGGAARPPQGPPGGMA